MVMDDTTQDEEEELQEIKDYLELFKVKVRNRRIGNERISYMKGYNNWEEYEQVMEKHYDLVKGISILRNYDFGDPEGWRFTMEFTEDKIRKTVKLKFYQMKIECPHLVAFYVNFNHPEWPVEHAIWRWCANRRMVPLGDP